MPTGQQGRPRLKWEEKRQIFGGLCTRCRLRRIRGHPLKSLVDFDDNPTTPIGDAIKPRRGAHSGKIQG